jgi:hypothetical protein
MSTLWNVSLNIVSINISLYTNPYMDLYLKLLTIIQMSVGDCNRKGCKSSKCLYEDNIVCNRRICDECKREFRAYIGRERLARTDMNTKFDEFMEIDKVLRNPKEVVSVGRFLGDQSSESREYSLSQSPPPPPPPDPPPLTQLIQSISHSPSCHSSASK